MLQGRRERKALIQSRAIEEVTEFAAAAPVWIELVSAAIKGRGGQTADEEEAFGAAGATLSEARSMIGRLVVAVGGPDSKVAEAAIGIIALLEVAVEELREWPPEVEDDEVEWTDEMTVEERDEEYARAWNENFEERIGEATLLLGLAQERFARFTARAAQHLNPTFADRARQLLRVFRVRSAIRSRRYGCAFSTGARWRDFDVGERPWWQATANARVRQARPDVLSGPSMRRARLRARPQDDRARIADVTHCVTQGLQTARLSQTRQGFKTGEAW
jgi:hypothetical protein